MDIKQKVIEKFNEILGDDIKNLDNIKSFHEQLVIEKKNIKDSVRIY